MRLATVSEELINRLVHRVETLTSQDEQAGTQSLLADVKSELESQQDYMLIRSDHSDVWYIIPDTDEDKFDLWVRACESDNPRMFDSLNGWSPEAISKVSDIHFTSWYDETDPFS